MRICPVCSTLTQHFQAPTAACCRACRPQQSPCRPTYLVGIDDTADVATNANSGGHVSLLTRQACHSFGVLCPHCLDRQAPAHVSFRSTLGADFVIEEVDIFVGSLALVGLVPLDPCRKGKEQMSEGSGYGPGSRPSPGSDSNRS